MGRRRCVTRAEQAWGAYQSFLKDPGLIVVGAAQGASCFGPAYDMAFILDADLRKKKLQKKMPIYFVTPEPYIGHMGLAGVGKSRRLMEDEFAEHSIKPLSNMSIKEVQPGKMLLEDGQEVPFRYSMMIPPFAGVDAVAGTAGLCNPKGFVNIDAYQANPKYKNIYAVGVCVAIPPVEQTPVIGRSECSGKLRGCRAQAGFVDVTEGDDVLVLDAGKVFTPATRNVRGSCPA